MNPSLARETRWRPFRWWISVLGVLALQIAALLALSRREPKPPPAPAPLRVYFAGDGHRFPALQTVLALHDPTILPLARRHDRAAEPFRTTNAPAYAASIPDEPLHWLAPKESEGLDDVHRLLAEARRPMDVATIKLAPRPEPVKPKLQPFPPRPVLRIEGDFARHPWRARLSVPTNVAPTILSNTVIRLTLDQQGRCLWTALLSGSGSAEADRKAGEFARSITFDLAGGNPESEDRSSALPLGTSDLVVQWFPQVSSGPAPVPPASP